MLNADPVDLLSTAVDLIIEGNLAEAREMIGAIDEPALRMERRMKQADRRNRLGVGDDRPDELLPKDQRVPAPPASVVRAVYERDRYLCRYCGRRTTSWHVMRQVSNALPDAFPTHPNWKLAFTHTMYWTHTTSLEHFLARARGGTNDPDTNLLTACYLCQDTKNVHRIEVLGWQVLPRPDASRWDGLTGKLDQLTVAVAQLHTENAAAEPENDRPDDIIEGDAVDAVRPVDFAELQAGDFVHVCLPTNKTMLNYRVVATEADRVDLVQMWRSAGRWEASSQVRSIIAGDNTAILRFVNMSPSPGDDA